MTIGNVNGRFQQLIGQLRQVKAFVSPVPTSHKEMRHIHDAFRTLGTLELFEIQKSEPGMGLYGREIVLTYNTGSDVSVLDPATELSEQLATGSVSRATQEQQLARSLERIIALPRSSFASEYEGYQSEDAGIPFTYKIPQLNRADLIGKFELSQSKPSTPFCSITNETIDYNDIQTFRKIIRYNMTKFHKFSFTPLRKIVAKDICPTESATDKNGLKSRLHTEAEVHAKGFTGFYS